MHLLRSFYARSYYRMPRTSRPHVTYGARYARRGPKGLFSEPADPWRSCKRPRCLSGRRSTGIKPPNLPPPPASTRVCLCFALQFKLPAWLPGYWQQLQQCTSLSNRFSKRQLGSTSDIAGYHDPACGCSRGASLRESRRALSLLERLMSP